MSVKMYFDHIFNPLHVMCRLKNLGFTLKTARRISIMYENYVFNPILKVKK